MEMEDEKNAETNSFATNTWGGSGSMLETINVKGNFITF